MLRLIDVTDGLFVVKSKVCLTSTANPLHQSDHCLINRSARRGWQTIIMVPIWCAPYRAWRQDQQLSRFVRTVTDRLTGNRGEKSSSRSEAPAEVKWLRRLSTEVMQQRCQPRLDRLPDSQVSKQ